ncbi:polyribonucleotide nucleotidyltransferase [Thermodesulfitimonas autotrophica]|uniref:Polyribonucleotide nucleotidyltransferase n=1 Tax=Thermodesulfitimonas autotrophica TaxID=1894989 RepID=A0A3N5BSZ4_9THEO|nr:polyribonucleotide nucleotidyltransferase [Thermodesulfitimonas autotrophica]RPF46891.1 polyribonucleotide nucleotidyltransferase [Thermodesulfitimonas autotrophica]
MQDRVIHKKEMVIGGRPLVLEVGRVARQASGAVLARYGDTVVLVTATMAAEPREGIDFFPLLVDYEERHYAVGKIPGGFLRREGKPGEKAVLSARLIDRSIRPLFPQKLRRDVHVVATIMSVDQDCAPEITAMIGASAALSLSEIPFAGPIGGVIVGLVDGEYVINPTVAQEERNKLHLVVAGTRDAIMMVECGAKEVPESEILEAIDRGHQVVREIVDFIAAFREEALALGLASPKLAIEFPEPDPVMVQEVREAGQTALAAAIRRCVDARLDKKAREELVENAKKELTAALLEKYPEAEALIREELEAVEKKIVRELIRDEKIRIDGRGLREIRPLSVEVGVLPRAHGSGLFTRGQTQVLSAVTLGPVGDEQILDGLGIEETKRFMHHYNFPPYSTGEARPIRSPGRREIGHGALAERALEAVLPPEDVFPYTIRIVSEVLESNGSTSMASVCASTLALMDAGVPIKAPVAGIAMGLIKDGDTVSILTDIQGVEDRLGDMDFKVAGSAAGVTALQMDIKIPGVTREILERALAQAREARLYILETMKQTIAAPRPELSPYAPRVLHMVIDPEKIRDVIGPGGKVIRKIIELTGAEIDVEDDGRVYITAPTEEAGRKAMEIIQNLTAEVTVGQVYLGRVTRVADFGCFVEIIPGVLGLPGKEGLVHISQLAPQRVEKVEDVVKEGDQILVKVIGYDNQGKIKLSKKEAMRAVEQRENKRPDRRSQRIRIRSSK